MLHVDKVDTLLAETVKISASKLTPFQGYKFHLRLNHEGKLLRSYCVIKSDKDGTIDLSRDAPVRGTYHEVDSMGLFRTVELTDDVTLGTYVSNPMATPFFYKLQLISESEEIIDEVNMKKRWTHPSVIQVDIVQDGMYGVVFKPPGPGPFPCIIDVQGVSGRLTKGHSSVLSAEGFMVCTFATFRYEDLPEKLQDVDIEVFSKHFRYVQSLPYCSDKIALFGLSLGGTIVNYLASKHPELTAVVSINGPESFYSPTGVFKENGKPMHCEEIDESLPVAINGVHKQAPMFLETFSKLKPETSLKWNEISRNIAFRLVTSIDDWMLCGVTHSIRNRENLFKTGHNVEIELVPGGHYIHVPYFPYHYLYAYSSEMFLGFGGDRNPHTKSQVKVWNNHLKFLKKHLGTPAKLPNYDRETYVEFPGEINSKL
ncbi:hypothetical protein CRE_08744 [Caenorhabditis remanei]|uniref:BAAT/Acyl-CoA thioester hydrolase C-terminal domain-containing protein n=1 Tax=Caenorhabditis remanei TaxID=31234 RepID=E3LHA3_CAERE|nr:hypothetical protein CRE_08744 [Caenorhabditis remanei]